MRLPTQIVPPPRAQGFDLLDGRRANSLHLLFAEQSGTGFTSLCPVTASARFMYGCIGADAMRSSASGEIFRSPIGVCFFELSAGSSIRVAPITSSAFQIPGKTP